jgi:hypothetical protein
MTYIKTCCNRVSRSLSLLIAVLWLCSACGGSDTNNDASLDGSEAVSTPVNGASQQGDPKQNLPVPNNQQTDHFRIILFGNSHVSGLGELIRELIITGTADAQVDIVSFGGGFLDDTFVNAAAQAKFEAVPWSHAIFQGQKYSQSGVMIYPTIAAEKWLDKAKSLSVTPILFPEHPQRGDTEEGQYVYDIHQGITKLQSSCLAPIPIVWERVLQLSPNASLYAADGNHAAYLGRFLTALVFYEVITGRSADLLPFLPSLAISESIQSLFGQVVSEVLSDKPACPTF